ncbi:hypothetical protein V1499_10495 [Neobacillus sp. SCS-31]|uniref:hypothetical protein n=1 Tax=Neobacillus oceani TaxID=3115292 RepID=UPI00390668C5
MRKFAAAGIAALALSIGTAGCSSDEKKEDKPVMNEKGTKQTTGNQTIQESRLTPHYPNNHMLGGRPLKRNQNQNDDQKLDDKQVAENLTDLVRIINANGDTKEIERIIAENPSSTHDDSEPK